MTLQWPETFDVSCTVHAPLVPGSRRPFHCCLENNEAQDRAQVGRMSSSDEPPPLVDSSSDSAPPPLVEPSGDFQPPLLAESSTSDSTSASSDSHSSLPELFPIAEFPRPPPTEEFLAAFHTAVWTWLQALYVEEELLHVIKRAWLHCPAPGAGRPASGPA